MTAPKFIALNGALNTKPLRMRADRIDAFERLGSATAVYVGSETYKVTDTPEQIDALLGVTDGWRCMDSAPKDGTEVLLWLGEPWSRVEKARWYDPWANWLCGTIPTDPAREEMYGICSAVPTHWMPLPAPPAIASATGTDG